VLAEVESDLLASGVHRDVPLVVEVDDILEALEDAVMHVSLDKIRRWPLVCAAHARSLERSAKLADVTRNTLVESGAIGCRIGVSTQTVVNTLGSERVLPMRVWFLVGLLVIRITQIFRDAWQYMVKVSFPCVVICIAGTAAEEWHWKHWAWPKYAPEDW
jgi:hypothetical protein